MDHICVGIDMSLTSPGMCIYNKQQKTFYMYYFAQRKRDVPHPNKSLSPHCFICCLPPIPKANNATNVMRYTFICESLVQQIISDTVVDSVIIEDYAYSCSSSSAHAFKLHELGGVFKYLCHKNNIKVETINISTWKKRAIGHGRASKYDTLQHVHKKLGVDLLVASQCKLKVNKETKEITVPNPAQDMADAVGIVLAALLPPRKAGTKRKKSRVRVTPLPKKNKTQKKNSSHAFSNTIKVTQGISAPEAGD